MLYLVAGASKEGHVGPHEASDYYNQSLTLNAITFSCRFEIVDCSEVILKVASRSCAHSDWHGFNGFECQDGEYCDDYWTRRKDGRIPDLGNKPDCHVGINWT